MTLEELAKRYDEYASYIEECGEVGCDECRARNENLATAAALRELSDCRPAVDYLHPSTPNPELKEQTDAALEKCR